jgi:hypothetical protein
VGRETKGDCIGPVFEWDAQKRITQYKVRIVISNERTWQQDKEALEMAGMWVVAFQEGW